MEGGTYFVAMPEQRASVFRATRSPRRMFRTGPRTVAQCLTGVKVSPSLMCHSTLLVSCQLKVYDSPIDCLELVRGCKAYNKKTTSDCKDLLTCTRAAGRPH